MANKYAKYFSHLLLRLFQRIRILLYLLFSSANVSGKVIRKQPVLLIGRGSIKFHGAVVIGVLPSPNFLTSYAHIEARKASAKIEIGYGTRINNNFCAIAEHTYISIGENCRIGHDVEILDSDFHGLEVKNRDKSNFNLAKPVVIGRNVFIGAHVRILKGVSVGDGAVIANSALVTKNVAAHTLVGGNPAKFIKSLSAVNNEK